MLKTFLNLKFNLLRPLKKILIHQRVNGNLSKGALTSSLREIDEATPTTWEFSAFSQNGEDGIIDFLTRQLSFQNRYFIEIGSSNGIECNSAFLAIARKYSGLMIEGDFSTHKISSWIIPTYNLGVESIRMFVSQKNIGELGKYSLFKNPDVFSLDIDGNDFYMMNLIFNNGFRPKIVIVEYNSAFGPYEETTIEYKEDFSIYEAHSSHLYYGVSVRGWRKFFLKYNYEFVTVDSNGVNAFFINKSDFKEDFYKKLKGLEYAENFYQVKKFRTNWEGQFDLIKEMPFKKI